MTAAYGKSAGKLDAGYASHATTDNHLVSMEKIMFCLHCVNFNLRDYPAHVKVGLGRCMAANLYSKGAVFMPIRTVHECDKYDPVKDDVLIKRKEWNESRKGR